MKNLSMVGLFIIILGVTIACTGIQSQNQTLISASPLPEPTQLSPLPAPDILETAMRSHAGVNRINCGVVPIDGETTAANQCVDEAYQAKQAFIVVYHLQGIDSFAAEGLSGNAQGDIRAYSYDSDPGGGGKPVGNPYEVVYERECHTIIPISDFNQERRGCE